MQQRWIWKSWLWMGLGAMVFSGCLRVEEGITQYPYTRIETGVKKAKDGDGDSSRAALGTGPEKGTTGAPDRSRAALGTGPEKGTTQTLAAPVEMPIDLPTVLRLAGTDALEVKLAGLRLAAARAQRLAADFQFLPTIQPGITHRWYRGEIQNVEGAFLDVDKELTTMGVGAAAEWRLGEAVYQSLAARRRVTAGEAALQTSKDETRIAAVNAYYNLVQARADQAILEERIKQADETVRITTALQEVGAGLLSEVKRAQAARAQVRQQLAAARERVRRASLELTTVLHIDPLVSLNPQQEPQELVALVPQERALAELVAGAMQARPEVAESRARIAALNADLKGVTVGPLVPTLRADAFDGGLGPRPNSTRETTQYGIGLAWNIGRGGIGDISRSRLARGQLRQEEVRLAALQDRIAREVIEQHTRVATTREQIKLAQEEIAAAEEALRLSRERMRSGAALTIEVLNAEDALLSARLRAAQQVSEFNKAQYGLLRAVGGFEEIEEIENHE